MALGGRDVDRPVAGAADISFAARLDALEGPLRALVVMLAAGRADQFAEFVVEALGAEVAFLLGHPLLQAKVRLDDELAHGSLLAQLSSNSTSSAPSATCSPTA